MGPDAGSFYEPLGEGLFRATELTASPWGTGSQHGGPPAALLARSLESETDGEGGIFARLAFEFLGPIPVGELSVETKTVRPGRRVSLRESTLSDGTGRPVMLCRAWRISASPASLPDEIEPDPATLRGPEEGEEKPFFEMAPEVGYHQGIEARFVEGSWRELGHAAAWLRMLAPLLPGEGSRRRGLRQRRGCCTGHLRVDVRQPGDHNSSARLPGRRVGRAGVIGRRPAQRRRPHAHHHPRSHLGTRRRSRTVLADRRALSLASRCLPLPWPPIAPEPVTRLPDLAVGEVEVGLPRQPIRRLLPAAGDRVAVIAYRRAEALRERLALAPELPLPFCDAHLVDPADAALVGVELEVGPVRGVASHDRDPVGRLGHVHRRALHQVCS